MESIRQTTFDENFSDEISFRLLHDFFVPRPVTLIATTGNGIFNVAPFSYINAAATRPAAVMFSVLQKEDGTEKDTLRNLRQNGHFTVNAVTEAIVARANACGAAAPAGISEFSLCGLTPVPSVQITAPRVLESPVQLECVVMHLIPIGDAGPGSAHVCIGKIVAAHVDERFHSGNGVLAVEAMRLVGRCSVDRYLVAAEFFQLDRPHTGDSGI